MDKIIIDYPVVVVPKQPVVQVKRVDKTADNNQNNHRNSCFIFQAAFLGLLLNGFFVDILSMRSFWVSLSLVAVTANLVAREKGRT